MDSVPQSEFRFVFLKIVAFLILGQNTFVTDGNFKRHLEEVMGICYLNEKKIPQLPKKSCGYARKLSLISLDVLNPSLFTFLNDIFPLRI